VQLGNLNGRDHLGDKGNRQGDNIRTELQKQHVMVWAGFIWNTRLLLTS